MEKWIFKEGILGSRDDRTGERNSKKVDFREYLRKGNYPTIP